MANRYKGEVPYPIAGKKSYLRFELDDLAALEDEFGRDFFDTIVDAAAANSPRDLPKCLAIGLKVRANDSEERVWQDIDKRKLVEDGFKIGDAGPPILDAIAYSWLGKSYKELVAEAVEANKRKAIEAVREAKEVADAAGVPFDSGASLQELLRLATGLGSQSENSGG